MGSNPISHPHELLPMNEDSLPYSLRQLLQSFREKPGEEPVSLDAARIKVNDTVSKVAFFYERFRNAIDYKDEHLLRKNAIERILKRRLVAGASISDVSQHLIVELIRGRYLPNNRIPETKILEIARTIQHEVMLLQTVLRRHPREDFHTLRNFILGIAAVEIERQLVSAHREDALVDFAFRTVNENLEWNDETIAPKDRSTLLFLAIHRALIKSDVAILAHRLWNIEFGEWRTATPESIEEAGQNILRFRQEVDRLLHHPMQEYLFLKMKKTSILFLILRDIIDANPSQGNAILVNVDGLEEKIRSAFEERYKKAHVKLVRSVKRSLVYLLMTKTILALVIELPFDRYMSQNINYFPLLANIFFHPLALFFLAVTIPLPGKQNTERILQGIREIITIVPKERPQWRIRPVRRRTFLLLLFQFLYGIAFLISFGVLISILLFLQFNVVSIFFFLFFLTVVSFIGIKLRQDVQELKMQTVREGFVNILFDFFTLPIVRVGHWLSLKAPKFNVAIFILDILIEAPFKSFVDISEQWVEYLKEKKEEIY